MKIRSVTTALTATALAVSISIISVPLAHASVALSPGSFKTVAPTRVLDTRTGKGAHQAALAAHGTLTFAATGGIGGPVSAVALTVTAVNPKKLGYLTVYAAGTGRPLASNLNFQIGENVPNMVITPVGAAGQVSVYNGSDGTVDVLADVSGFYVGGAGTVEAGGYVTMASKRFLDTRIGLGAPRRPAGPDSVIVLKVAGVNGVPYGASAAVMNVTASAGTASGFFTAYAGAPVPATSTVNYLAGKNRANLALVPIGADGNVSFVNGSTGSSALIVDVTGYFLGGTPATDGAFISTTPYRTFDSRGEGGRPAAALTVSKVRIFPNASEFSVFAAVVVNVTAAEPQSAGFLTTWDGTTRLPSVSSNNFQRHQDAAGTVILPVNVDGTISIYNGSYGSVDYVVDVIGFVYHASAVSPNTASADRNATASVKFASALAKIKLLSRTVTTVPTSVTTSR